MVFRSHPRHRILTLACLGLTALLAVSLLREVSLGTLFFTLMSAGLTLWYGQAWLSRVRVNEDHITLERPVRPPRRVAYRQLMSVSESGRFGNSVILLYHPLLPDGLVDLQNAQSLFLPQVAEQAELVAHLEARRPS